MSRVIILNADKIQQILRREDHELTVCQNAGEVCELVSERTDFDLLITEAPELHVLDSLFKITRPAKIPILVVVPGESPAQEILFLEQGANAVIPRPVEPSVLLAKVRALTRSGLKQAKEKIYVFGDLMVDASRFTVTCAGRELRLTAGQFKVLLLLIRKPGEVLSRAEVISEISPELPENSRSVDTLISSLRSELREAGALIESKRGVGYVLRKAAFF